jgi:hypothetical protein
MAQGGLFGATFPFGRSLETCGFRSGGAKSAQKWRRTYVKSESVAEAAMAARVCYIFERLRLALCSPVQKKNAINGDDCTDSQLAINDDIFDASVICIHVMLNSWVNLMNLFQRGRAEASLMRRLKRFSNFSCSPGLSLEKSGGQTFLGRKAGAACAARRASVVNIAVPFAKCGHQNRRIESWTFSRRSNLLC